MRITTCKLCGAEIVWCYNSRSGRMAAIEYTPAPDGNVYIREGSYTPVFVTLSRQAAAGVVPMVRRREHRCAERKAWTKGGRVA